MKVKTADLTGAALDWAVAKAEGVKYRYMNSSGGDYNGNWWWETRAYSTDWAQGGPIIEREGITVQLDKRVRRWQAYAGRKTGRFGPTALIAAMRCFVASKLGDDVGVPEELMT